MLKTMTALGLALATLSAPALAQMADPASGAMAAPMNAASLSPMQFVAMAGASDKFEIESSRLILQSSKNPKVRNFATTMIHDHTMTTRATMAAAHKSGLNPPPPQLNAEQQQMMQQLRSATGEARDQAYLQDQLPAHEQALQLVQGYAANGSDPNLRQAAQTAVPIVQKHIAMLQSIMNGGSSSM